MSHRLNSGLQGLYVITDSQLLPDDTTLLHGVAAAIKGGARIVQYRDKSTDHSKRLRQSRALLALCREQQVPLLINDDIVLAAEIGADGVHVGIDDASLELARNTLGEQAIIGVSCYNRLALAEKAQQGGASYVAFGRFFSSKTKPDAAPADSALLIQAQQTIHLPIVAIGGITVENAQPLVSAGVDMLAVVHGVFAATDVQAAAKTYSEIFTV